MVKNTLFTTLALAVAAVAATDPVTTQIFLAGFAQQPIDGSVIASDATATTFSVACQTGAANCAIPPSFTFTQGPSTIHYAYTHQAQSSGDFTGTIDVGCKITALTGTCSKSVNAILGTITSAATSSTTTFSGASEMGGQILTITGGNLVVPTTASSTSSASNSSAPVKSHYPSSYTNSTNSSTVSTSSSYPVTLAPTATGALTTGSPSSTQGVSSSSVTGGMPIITGSAQWVMGGVAAMAVALAAL